MVEIERQDQEGRVLLYGRKRDPTPAQEEDSGDGKWNCRRALKRETWTKINGLAYRGKGRRHTVPDGQFSWNWAALRGHTGD